MLSEQLSGIADRLGKTFMIAGYLPALLFVIAHQLLLFPRWQIEGGLLLQTPAPEEGAAAAWRWTYFIDQTLTILLLPLLLGVLLMSLNTLIIKLFEGEFRWQQKLLLRPWQQSALRRQQALFGNLAALKEAYTQVLADLAGLPPGADDTELQQKRISLALALQERHNQAGPLPVRLPRRPARVRPTRLGNGFAAMEEYPYERYGMDAVIFWPRLRPLLDESYAAMLVNRKMILDLLLNMALLAWIFALELGLQAVIERPWNRGLVIVAGAGLLFGYFAYQGAVQTAYSLGDLVSLCFDFFRGRLAKQFNLELPPQIEAEQVRWLRLGRFLRFGEGFYYPESDKPPADKPPVDKPPAPPPSAVSAFLRWLTTLFRRGPRH